MAQHQLKDVEKSQKSLPDATARIPVDLATLGQKDFEKPLPVSISVIHPDWLITEILRREATLLIHQSERRPSAFRSSRGLRLPRTLSSCSSSSCLERSTIFLPPDAADSI